MAELIQSVIEAGHELEAGLVVAGLYASRLDVASVGVFPSDMTCVDGLRMRQFTPSQRAQSHGH